MFAGVGGPIIPLRVATRLRSRPTREAHRHVLLTDTLHHGHAVTVHTQARGNAPRRGNSSNWQQLKFTVLVL